MAENKNNSSDIILYSSPEGNIKVEVIYSGETFWLTQKRMAELFGVDRLVITKHLQNIFTTNELAEESVCANFAHTAEDGKTYQTNFYNLDAIIAVGYRVNSKQATQFRIWATKTLREFIIKGFVLDDERMKQGKRFGKEVKNLKRKTKNEKSIKREELCICNQDCQVVALLAIGEERICVK